MRVLKNIDKSLGYKSLSIFLRFTRNLLSARNPNSPAPEGTPGSVFRASHRANNGKRPEDIVFGPAIGAR